jgi:arylsulfatase A
MMHTVLLLVAATVATAAAAGKKNPPNFLLFLADDLGYGDLGVTGHPTSHTPAIDQLAAEGLRLTSFYTASPVCSPSRAGIATGRFPARSGVFCANETNACGDTGTGSKNGNSSDYRHCCNGVFLPGMPGGMSKSELTTAQLLKPRGYRSMMIGKWHLGIGSHPGATDFLPTSRGFDRYYGVPHGLGAPSLLNYSATATLKRWGGDVVQVPARATPASPQTHRVPSAAPQAGPPVRCSPTPPSSSSLPTSSA